jgi:hypothetical protein
MSYKYSRLLSKSRNRRVMAISAIAIVATVLLVSLLTQYDGFESDSSVAAQDKQLIEDTRSLQEVNLFLGNYPDVTVEVDRSRSVVDGDAVKYSFQKTYEDGSISQTVRLYVIPQEGAGNDREYFLHVDCITSNEVGTGMTEAPNTENIVEYLQETECAK